MFLVSGTTLCKENLLLVKQLDFPDFRFEQTGSVKQENVNYYPQELKWSQYFSFHYYVIFW